MNSLAALTEKIKPELTFETSRSSGKGGQHVNKTETRVTLVWNFIQSKWVTQDEKELIIVNCKSYVSGEVLRISVEEFRSQVKNKKKSIYKLKKQLEAAFKKEKVRKKSSVPYSVKRKRMKDKKIVAEKKNSRKKIDKRGF